MKTFRYLFFSAVLVFSGTAYAQNENAKKNKAKGKKDQAIEQNDVDEVESAEEVKGKKPQNPGKAKKDNPTKNNEKVKGNQGQGKAYGRDKGGLSGREFGQQRAAEAKARLEESEEELTVVEDKLATAKKLLTEKIKAGTISEEDATSKQLQIEEAEQKVVTLKEKVTTELNKITEAAANKVIDLIN